MKNKPPKEKWSVRELRRQKNSMLFERITLSKDKNSAIFNLDPIEFKKLTYKTYAKKNMRNAWRWHWSRSDGRHY